MQVVDGTSMPWWKGSNGVKNYFWDGKHSPSDYACACDVDGNCLNKSTKCNCNAGATGWSSDAGVLTDIDILPVAELSFGVLEFDSQVAQFELGPLKCSGRQVSL
jgi:hypothetical protein